MRPLRRAVVITVGVAIGAVSCSAGDGDGGRGQPTTPPTSSPASSSAAQASLPVDPADFVATIDNPFMPLAPGTRFTYRGKAEDGMETNVVTVTRRTKEILGVPAVVVHDTVEVRGEITEDTFDWYAQDRAGNVWYFGEDTKEYEDGKVTSTEGSWEAGVDGAQPGIVMKAQPEVGEKYRQEHYRGHAEDMAQVLGLTERASVPYGSFDHLLLTAEFTPLEPGVLEHKYYARGIGLVLVHMVKGGNEQAELISIVRQQ